MTLRKYRFGDRVNDDFAIDELFDRFMGWPFHSSYSFKGQIVNPEEYDLVPKKSYIERRIKEAEEWLRRHDETKNQYLDRWQKQRNDKENEINELRRKLYP